MKGKEIENLLPDVVLRAVVLKRSEEFASSVDKIVYDDYVESEDGIGAYLDRVLGVELSKSVFADDTGTVKNKIGFCRKAVAWMDDSDNEWKLPQQVKTLCERIYSHVVECNK